MVTKIIEKYRHLGKSLEKKKKKKKKKKEKKVTPRALHSRAKNINADALKGIIFQPLQITVNLLQRTRKRKFL